MAAFAGTAIRVGDATGNTGTDARLERLLILGFDTAIEVILSQRVTIASVAADCRNGIVLRESYDVSRLRDVHLWPFVTGNLAGISIATFTVAGVANAGGQVRITTAGAHGLLAGDVVHVTDVGGVPGANGRYSVAVPAPDQLDLAGSVFSGAWSGGGRVAVWANRRSGVGFRIDSCDAAELRGCFAYGFQTGFRIEGASMATQLFGCGYDDRADIRDESTIGLSLGGSCYRTKWVGGYVFSTGTSILADSAATGQNHHHIVGAQISGGHVRAIDMRRGGLTIEGCDFTGGLSGTGRVWIADTAASLALLGSDIRPLVFEGQSAAALARLILAGNRTATTGGAASLAGGSIELRTTDPAATGGLATRVEIANDGAVGLRRRAGGLGARLVLRDPADAEAFALAVEAGATVVQTGAGGSLAGTAAHRHRRQHHPLGPAAAGGRSHNGAAGGHARLCRCAVHRQAHRAAFDHRRHCPDACGTQRPAGYRPPRRQPIGGLGRHGRRLFLPRAQPLGWRSADHPLRLQPQRGAEPGGPHEDPRWRPGQLACHHP